jgi:hypothetical protein
MRYVSAASGPDIRYSCIVTDHVLLALITACTCGSCCMNGCKKKIYESTAITMHATNKNNVRVDSLTVHTADARWMTDVSAR